MCKFWLKECFCVLKNIDYENYYNVKDVWRMNYIGVKVVVVVVDEGLSLIYFELRKNYVSVEIIVIL